MEKVIPCLRLLACSLARSPPISVPLRLESRPAAHLHKWKKGRVGGDNLQTGADGTHPPPLTLSSTSELVLHLSCNYLRKYAAELRGNKYQGPSSGSVSRQAGRQQADGRPTVALMT